MGSSPEYGRFDKIISIVCYHCELLRPLDVVYRMGRVKRKLHENGVNLDDPCSADASTVCWLLDSLCPWNAILYKGGLGLHEEELGCLTCKTHAVPKCKDLFGTEGAILEAAYLLYRLCEQHRCLRRLVVKERYPLQDRSYWGALLKLSLEASKGLWYVDVISTLDEHDNCCVLNATSVATAVREIKCSISLSHEHPLSQMLEPNGNKLTELVLGYPAMITTTAYLFSNLRFCSSLKRLELNVLKVDVVVFIDFMINNKTIAHLSLSQVFPTTANLGEGVASLLQVNTTLKVLQLRMRGGDATLISRSLFTNTTLRSLSLHGFENLALSSMAELVILNNTLLELRLSARSLQVGSNELAAALMVNNTLRTLCLRTPDIESAHLLVGSLKHNSTLLTLNVGAVRGSVQDEAIFKMTLLKPWAVGRVVTNWDGKVCLNLAHALNSGAAPASLDIWYTLGEHCVSFCKLGHVCDSLRNNRSIRSLTLCVDPCDVMDKSVSQKLGGALCESRTLETVKLSFTDLKDGSTMKFVCEGLNRSSTICCLKITVRANVPDVLKYMAAVLECNRVIKSLDLSVTSLPDRGYFSLQRIDEWTEGWTSLSKAIEANRDLLQVYASVKGHCVSGFASDFALTVQRNLCGLQQAVRFARKPTMNKRAAEMFQRYENSRELFRRLQRSESTTYRGTSDLILAASDFIDSNYFIVTGIVKGTLQCERSSTTSTWLDDLNGACLCRIASFLRVADVKS